MHLATVATPIAIASKWASGPAPQLGYAATQLEIVGLALSGAQIVGGNSTGRGGGELDVLAKF